MAYVDLYPTPNCYASQRAREMVPTRPAAPEMVPCPAGVGEAPIPDGRVLFDLASSCLAYGYSFGPFNCDSFVSVRAIGVMCFLKVDCRGTVFAPLGTLTLFPALWDR